MKILLRHRGTTFHPAKVLSEFDKHDQELVITWEPG